MRARTASRATLAALSALGLVACQEPDVGDPCTLDVQAGSPPALIDVDLGPGVACTTDTYAADYFRSGALECDNLICLRTATGDACSNTGVGATSPHDVRKYCSKACVSDKDCENDRIHLVCRPIVLDTGYLVYLTSCAADPARIDPTYGPCPPPATVTAMLTLLGSVPSSNYCATP
ncbi:MAG TPA: adventurous gliding motility lipoprotein CglC [Anaeromyxobacteraceae bacterium]|nr:adventurous gliding motility lipoprotein CglC [Anaeromyxobacteraceae bacterium]